MNGYPRIGSCLGNYRIDELIGRGGMSAVYLAEHLGLGRKVALKILSSELAEDDTFRKRFVRESRLVAALDSPNIVPVYEADEDGGVLYIAMQYVDGADLGAILRTDGVLAPGRTVHVLQQVAAALDTAHMRGLVHRDVKPSNILVRPSDDPDIGEHVYLADFGLAKATDSRSGLTQSGAFMGTIDYMAPEQINGQRVDARTDVYSLGCVSFECLTGRPPFDRGEPTAVLYAHLLQAPPRVTDVRPDLSPAVDEVVATAMAKRMDHRYGSARELVGALRTAVGAGEQHRPPPGTASPPGTDRTTALADVRPEAYAPATVTATRHDPRARTSARRHARLPRAAAAALAAGVLAAMVLATLLVSGALARHRTPSGPGGAPPAATTLPSPMFRDDFSHRRADWTTFASNGMSVSYADGGLRFVLQEPGRVAVSLQTSANLESLHDASIEVAATRVMGPEPNGIGVICRAVDAHDYYESVINTAGSFAIDKVLRGVFTRLETGSVSLHPDHPTWHLRAECSGGGTTPVLISLFVDGRRLGSATDPGGFESGAPGLTALTGDRGGLVVLFDDFVVRAG